MAFQSSDFESTRWRLFQKGIVRTKFDIYFFFNWIMDFMVCITILQLYWYVICSDLFMDETVVPGKKGEKHIQQQVINILYHRELYRVDLEQSGIKLAIEAIWIVCTGRHKSKHHSSQIRLSSALTFHMFFVLDHSNTMSYKI